MRRTLPLLALVLASCAAQIGDSPSASPEATPDSSRPTRTAPDLATPPPSDEPVTGEVPAEIMDDLRADAAERLGVDAADLEIVQAEAVTWNDGSLGCPEPGMSYTMALVDGYHVILEADAEQVDYRVSAQGGFLVCENAGRPSG
jgi:hypothetical protein